MTFSKYTKLPGTPDITFVRSRAVVFVHGCFWHGCPQHYRPPKTSLDYWIPKLARNQARDRVVRRRLRDEAWSVLTVWECQVKKDPMRVARRIRTLVLSRAKIRAGGAP
jgi:DNA mismatch endonuclease (patch repair protein)